MNVILVKFKEGYTVKDILHVVPSAKEVKVMFGITVVSIDITDEEAIALIEPTGVAEYAQSDGEYEILYDSYEPNDTNFSQQWALKNTTTVGADIKATYAWSRLINNSLGVGSADIAIGVVDSGIKYDHEDLSDVCAASQGYDYVNNDSNPMDDNGHGTHVAGIIGAKGQNSKGTVGIVWNCKLHALKVLNASMVGTDARILSALQYVDLYNIPIVNMSIGSSTYSQALRDAIYALRNKTLVVCGAGNNSANSDSSPVYPAAFDCPNIISVANTTSVDSLSGSSNYGASTVDLGAPGDSIYSTGYTGDYVFMSGTSMAAPHVTGVAAMILSVKPTLTIPELKAQILNNVDTIAALSGKCVTGGRLNAYKALNGLIYNVVKQSPITEPYENGNSYFRKNGQWYESSLAEGVSIEDTATDGHTTIGISSNWAYDHNNDITKHLPDAPVNTLYYARRNGAWASFDLSTNETNLSNYIQKTGYTDNILYALKNDAWTEVPTDIIAVLPDQTSNSGKYLRTNGSTAAWADAPGHKELIFTSEGEVFKTVFMYYRVPAACGIISMTASLLNKPVGDPVLIDIRKNSVDAANTMLSTPISITESASAVNGIYTSSGSFSSTELVSGDVLYIMVTQVGSTFKGTDLLIQVIVG